MKYLLLLLPILIACSQGITSYSPANGSSPCSVEPLSPSTNAPYGGSIISCLDGTSTVVLNGDSNLTLSAVQFCSGFTPSYPNVFPESGVCINDVMYGVYSANGGFLAEIPPGVYSSDGINASCTFTIGANCEVSQ